MDFLPLSIADILLPIVIAALIATSLFYILGSFFSLGKVGFAIIAFIGIIANVFYFKAQFISLFGEVGVNLKFLVLFPVVFCILYLLFSLFVLQARFYFCIICRNIQMYLIMLRGSLFRKDILGLLHFI